MRSPHRAAVIVLLCCACEPTLFGSVRQQPKGTSTITGTVVDEQHVPVARAQVQAFPGIERSLDTRGSAMTDGAGRFQITGLAPGDYVIAAEVAPLYPGGGPLPATVYGPTFFPSTLDVMQAAVVRAADHPEAPVQIELRPITPVRVTGTVVSRTSRETRGFDVRLFRTFGGFATGASVATVGARGIFEIPRVPPGVYTLTIEPRGSQRGQDGAEFVDRVITVEDRDLDLSLTVGPGASAAGRVVVTSGDGIRPTGLRVTANPHATSVLSGPPDSVSAAVNADWSFQMTGLSGALRFAVSSDRPPPAIEVTRVVADGTPYPADADVPLVEGHHDLVVFVQPRDAPAPAVDSTRPTAELVRQFKDEKMFWRQFEIGQAIAERRDPGTLAALADWLQHEDRHIRGNVAFVFASLGDPRGLQTIAGILADRTERPMGQGIPGVMGGDGRYHFEAQVAADRYYAAHLLGDLRDPRGIDLLIPLLGDRETQSIVPWSLGEIGDRRAIPPLTAALDTADPSMRVMVIYALETLHATEAVPRLRTLLSDHATARFGAGVSVSEAAKAAIASLGGY